MTEFELITILKETSVGIALDFEFFLTVTFALIVVSYTVGTRLGTSPRIVISVLYLAMVLLLLVRYQGQATQAIYVATKLNEMKSDYPTLDVEMLMWTRRFLFFAGTLAAIFALFKPTAAGKDDVVGSAP